ncbi:hypothetical protein ACWCXX_37495, partial [Streptomyces sp. NPDC001732]
MSRRTPLYAVQQAAFSNLAVVTTRWTVLDNDEAPGGRVLDQDHPCLPGVSMTKSRLLRDGRDGGEQPVVAQESP